MYRLYVVTREPWDFLISRVNYNIIKEGEKHIESLWTLGQRD